MHKLKIFMFWCLLVGTMVSCGDKKEDDPSPAAASQDYLPLTSGSTWNYGGTHPYSVNVTGATKVINGKTFVEVETKQGSTVNKGYMLKENGNYLAVGFLPNFGNLEMTLLKENAPVGESWVHTQIINGINNTMTLSIGEKNISKTVEGKTYNNVIRVRMVTIAEFMGMEMPVATTDYFFAKGVGLVLSESGTMLSTPLLTYTIK